MADIRRVDHVGIRIRDKERLVSFYEQFGFVLETGEFEFGNLRALFVRDPDGTAIELDERTDPTSELPPTDRSSYANHP